jgi:tRNA-splicing ligase RtcB
MTICEAAPDPGLCVALHIVNHPGQPVLIGGSMGTSPYVLTGALPWRGEADEPPLGAKNWSGRQIIDELKGRGIIVKSPSKRGVAEEAPGAYKNVGAVVEATKAARLARKVARLVPMICIKG